MFIIQRKIDKYYLAKLGMQKHQDYWTSSIKHARKYPELKTVKLIHNVLNVGYDVCEIIEIGNVVDEDPIKAYDRAMRGI